MNIIQQIDEYLSIEALRSRELFSRFDLLVKQEEWYYVNAHPAPAGVTAVQGPRGAWRWNASMARAAGVSEADIASATGDKTMSQMAEARAAAQPAMPAATPVDSTDDDVFEDWETFTATHRRITSAESKAILAQQKAAGVGAVPGSPIPNGKADKTSFPEPVAVVNKEGKITHATTMDGHLIPVTDSVTEAGKVIRKNLKFNTSATGENQAIWQRGQDVPFYEKGEYVAENRVQKHWSFATTSAGIKQTKLDNLSKVYNGLMSRIAGDLKSLEADERPKPLGNLTPRSIRESAFALALVDHTFKRIGKEKFNGTSRKDNDGKNQRPLSINKKANNKELKRLKEKGIKFSRDSKGRIYLRDKKGKRTDDKTKYDKKPMKTYGINNFRARHIKVDAAGNVRLKFLGKSAIGNDSPITDKFLAAELIKRKTAAEKLGRKANDKPIIDTSYGSVSKYLKESSGEKEIGIHKFRAYHATRLARKAVKAIGDAPKVSTKSFKSALKKEKNFENLTKAEKGNVAEAVAKDLQIKLLSEGSKSVGGRVAPHLAHENDVCVDKYIDHVVFEEAGWKKQFDAERKRFVKNVEKIMKT